jgi:hypothetical protein
MTGTLLANYGVSPIPFLGIVLGVIPVTFSVVFFLVALLRKLRLNRENDSIREETLRKRVLNAILASPTRVDPREIRPAGNGLDPRNFPAACKRMLERIAAAFHAEPIAADGGKDFTYTFPELQRQIGDVQQYRGSLDIHKYDVGKTVFDSGQ